MAGYRESTDTACPILSKKWLSDDLVKNFRKLLNINLSGNKYAHFDIRW